MARTEEDIETFEIRPAVRRAVPQIMAIYGVTFSGKTFGALMLAAGLAKPNAKIGFIDTENGRGSMYADDDDVRRVLPQGYHRIELHPPFHPKRYIAAIRQFEKEGFDLVITDSGSHGWEGEGGCLDIKEKDRGWNNAKLWNKRFSSALRYSPMHQIVCLRAQEKVKIVGTGKDQQYIPLGIMPICEKSFPFDLGLAFSVDGEIDGKPATHFARPVKWPKAMNTLFNNWKPQLLTPEIGKRIREWNETGEVGDPLERLKTQSRSVADEGVKAYEVFFKSLGLSQRKALIDSGCHQENKLAAELVDRELAEQAKIDARDAAPEPTEADLQADMLKQLAREREQELARQ